MSPLFRRSVSLAKAVDHLSELIEQHEENGLTWQHAVGAVCKEAERATPEEIKQAQERLAEMTMEVPLILASLFALGAGTLIERGADVEIPAKAIFERTYEALTLATRFGQACLEQEQRQQAEDNQHENEELDIEACIEKYGPSLASEMGEEAEGWRALEFFATAALAIMTRSPQQRALARNNALFMQALQECPADSALHCLRVALNLLENEKVIVLHPQLQRGYLIRINNIGLNFELNTLLTDALIGDPARGWLQGKKPDPRVVAAAKDGPFPMPGDKSARNFPTAEGIFNLWNWRGLQADGQLPTGFAKREHWVWNEGQPADIEPFEGTRVILLGPPPYHRTWNAGRFFPHMHSELEVLEQLSEEQTRQWLTRIAAAVVAD